MNTAMRKHIISELENMSDRQVFSIVDYIHFVNHEKERIPNKETMEAIRQADRDIETLKGYSSAEEIFKDLDIN